MADADFTDMETEAEGFVSQASLQRRRNQEDYKLNREPHGDDQHGDTGETSPLLGPPVLSEHSGKRWYNTASVCVSRLAPLTRA